MKSFQSQSHYEVLEVSVGASEGDIRSALERLLRLYAEDQVALYGLIDEGRARALRGRLQEAASVLLDEARRAAYDASIGLPPKEPVKPKPSQPPRMPETGAGWGGSFSFVASSAPTPVASTSFVYTVTAPVHVVAQPAIVFAAPPAVRSEPVASPLTEQTLVANESWPVDAPVSAVPPEVVPGPATEALERPAEAASAAVGEGAGDTRPTGERPAGRASASGPASIAPTPGAGEEAPPAPASSEAASPEAAAVPTAAPATPAPAAPTTVAPTTAGPTTAPLMTAAPASVAPPTSSAPAESGAMDPNGPAPAARSHPAESPPPHVEPAPSSSSEAPRSREPDEPEPASIHVGGSSDAELDGPAPRPSPVPLRRSHADEAPGGREREAEVSEALGASDDSESMAIVPTRPFTPREYRQPERPRPYEVPPGVEFNGDLLRQVRMARGLSLLQLSERTRIGVRHIENLEGDRYDQLPAMVYLRGMLMSLARELGLDGLRVSKSYLTFVEAHLAKSKG